MKSVFAHDHVFLGDGSAYYSKSGLPEAVLQRYAAAFDLVDVICRTQSVANTNLAPILDPRIQFYPQKNLRSLSGLTNIIRISRNIASLIKSADFVVARLPSTFGWLAAREARKEGVSYVVEVVGNAKEANMLHGSKLGKFVAPVEHWLTADEVLHAKNVIYITENYLQRIYPTHGRRFVCPNVNVNPVSESIVAHRIKRFKEGQRYKIGLIGSLDVNYKGHRSALMVLKLLSEIYGMSNVIIEFVGGGSQAGWQEYAKELGCFDRVIFKGSIPPGEKVMEWIDTVDLLLQPSQTEGQGRAIIEGMSRGCPVVASNAGGIPELLDHQMLTSAEDVDGLARRCVYVMTNNTVYENQSHRNWEKAHQFYPDVVERKRNAIFSTLRAEVSSVDGQAV